MLSAWKAGRLCSISYATAPIDHMSTGAPAYELPPPRMISGAMYSGEPHIVFSRRSAQGASRLRELLQVAAEGAADAVLEYHVRLRVEAVEAVEVVEVEA